MECKGYSMSGWNINYTIQNCLLHMNNKVSCLKFKTWNVNLFCNVSYIVREGLR